MTDSMKVHTEEAIIIKDMKKYLGNPKTISDLYKNLTALPKEEIYDFHPEERNQIHGIYGKMREDRSDRDADKGRIVYDLLRIKKNMENIMGHFVNAMENFSVEDYFGGSEDAEAHQALFEQKTKKFFSNLITQLHIHRKQITTEEIDYINYKIMERMERIQRIDDNELAILLSFLLQKHIYTGTDELETTLRGLMEIHGEDINRPLLGGDNIPKEEHTWISLLFMKYGFGLADIDEVLRGIERIVNLNKEKIEDGVEEFIPLYERLRSILEEETGEENTGKEVALPGEKKKLNIGTIDVKKVEGYVNQNKYLRVLKKQDKVVLEQKLQILRDICNLSDSSQKMIEE